jgi:hypothetical protein
MLRLLLTVKEKALGMTAAIAREADSGTAAHGYWW